MLIGIAGMVGSGKSTLTRALAARFGLQHALESVDEHNPWLERFYGGGVEAMRATALNLQLHFLATRFESMRRIRGAGGSWVLDRTWYEDAEIFARGHFDEGLMSELEWELYRRLYVELLHSPASIPAMNCHQADNSRAEPRGLLPALQLRPGFGPVQFLIGRFLNVKARPKRDWLR